MTDTLDTFHTLLREQFGDKLIASRIEVGQLILELLPENLIPICETLRDDERFSFEQLSDLCGIDYSTYGQADWETQETTNTGFSRGVNTAVYDKAGKDFPARFAVVYNLVSVKHNRRLRLRCYTPGEPPLVPTVVNVWASANWFEREAFDQFGILFEGHPDLRRILTDYGFIGHAFRKDFPLEGNVEVRYDPDKKRVIYEPVSIEPRTLVPRVIRDDGRFGNSEEEQQSE